MRTSKIGWKSRAKENADNSSSSDELEDNVALSRNLKERKNSQKENLPVTRKEGLHLHHRRYSGHPSGKAHVAALIKEKLGTKIRKTNMDHQTK